MLILHSSHQQKQRFIRFLVYFLLILIPIVHYWWINIYKPVVITFGHLKTVEETLHSNNGIVLDTYFRRIKQFLDKRNVSLLSYEQSSKIDDNLLSDIKKEILNLRQKQEQELLKIKNSEEISHGCEKSCCWSKKKMRKFYYGEKDYFPTVLDRLSQIDLKLLADLHYGTLRVPDGIQLSKLTSDLLPCLQNHTIIFVDTSELRHFLRNFHEKISVDYILMTGDSDLPCPFYLKHTHSHLLEQIFAGKTHILHWFSMNCHFGTNEQWKQSKILTCIPQGISQWLNQRYYMHLASGKDDSIRNKHLKTNDYWIFTSFNKQNGNDRQRLWDLSCHGRLQNISKCFYQLDSIDQWRYYQHIARSKFVLSPPGNGMDCYRTWEALYLGSIPIIVRQSINTIFQKLPVVVVDNYEEITAEFLKDIYENMTRQNYDYKRLYKGYWQKQINVFRNSSELIQIQYTVVKR